MSTALATIPEREDTPAVTKAFYREYQALMVAARKAAADLAEYEQQTFTRATPLARRRAQEIRQSREALTGAMTNADREMKAEFDRYSVRQAVAAR